MLPRDVSPKISTESAINCSCFQQELCVVAACLAGKAALSEVCFQLLSSKRHLCFVQTQESDTGKPVRWRRVKVNMQAYQQNGL